MVYTVHTKASWIQKMSSHWEDFFYPSLVKKINKSNGYFNDLFDFKINKIDKISDANDFFLLYDKEIASRGNYIYKVNEQRDALEEKIRKGKSYMLASLHKKDTGAYCGGIIFSIVEDRLSFALRAFDRQIRSSFRSLTTIDFWAEKEMYEYALFQNLKFLSHGNDNYPNKGRTGLVLFKLKVGGKPKISKKEHEILELSDEEIKQYNAPTFFWTNPDENEYFKKAHIFYKDEAIKEDVLSELLKVTAWAGIELVLHNL